MVGVGFGGLVVVDLHGFGRVGGVILGGKIEVKIGLEDE